MIDALVRAGANHYLFCVWDAASDFEDLRDEFAPAAQAAGIQIMVYLVPPTESQVDGRASRPYRLDFVAWAEELATLSLRYPVLTGWAIDDFDLGENAALFTPDYLTAVRTAQQAINPGLAFFTCAYFSSATTEELMLRYGPWIDGIIYPYLDGPSWNTIRPDRIDEDLALITEITAAHDVALIVLLYTGRFLDGVLAPTEDYVAACLDRALAAARDGRVLGVIAYGLQLDGAPTVATERRSMYGDGRGALVSSIAATPAGAWAELSAEVAVDPESPRYELSFWHSRTVQLGQTPRPGDLRLDLLVDGTSVWSADAHDATYLHLWVQGLLLQGPFEVTAAFQGRTRARLAFRLTAQRDLVDTAVDVGLDHLETIGFTVTDPGFEDPSAWTVASSHGPLVAVVDRFVPDRPARIVEAVAERYAAQHRSVTG